MLRPALFVALFLSLAATAQEHHDHPAPEKLGTITFPTSCSASVQHDFNRAVALLHSFTYKEADEGFHRVLQQDPNCAIAHWGSAMTHYHQLWDLPPSPPDVLAALQELDAATSMQTTERERTFLNAATLVFKDAATTPYTTRAAQYETAMQQLAAANPSDVETQVFYALALVSNASPADRTHRKQKQAADILEPLYRRYPDHPGIAHYLIHAYDNQELAARGLPAARLYAGIAPSAPHALHMPSHIFTRLGLWDDSIASNLAARNAAHAQHDTGEELHAMDYLVYAYLQSGRDHDAASTIAQIGAMQPLNLMDFKIGYASVAMPVRTIVEHTQWTAAATFPDPPQPALPHVTAIAVWARGIGLAHIGNTAAAQKEAARLQQLEDKLRAASNIYWATQVDIMRREVEAWAAQAANQPQQAVAILTHAADDEDAIEKLPVTPGPIVPAREQLGQLFLAQQNNAAAATAFNTALTNAPGRRGALQGAAIAAHPGNATASTH